MPERKKFSQPAEVVNQTLLLPDAFPSLPDSVEKRFGEDIANYRSETERWWSRTKRALIEGYQQTTIPQNETKKAVEVLNSEFISVNTTFSARIDTEIIIRTTADSALAVRATALEVSVDTAGVGLLARVSTVESTYATITFAEAKKTEAITAAFANSAAQVSVESIARATADGFLSSKYTLLATAGDVVTGINVTSASSLGRDVSSITFLTDNFNVVASTGPAVQLVALSASGFVFGTDILSDGFVMASTGWRVTRAGAAEFNNVTVRGAVFASSGSFTGAVFASSGSFTGAVFASSGSFTGAVFASSGSFTGTLLSGSGPNRFYADAAGTTLGDPSGVHFNFSNYGPDSQLTFLSGATRRGFIDVSAAFGSILNLRGGNLEDIGTANTQKLNALSSADRRNQDTPLYSAGGAYVAKTLDVYGAGYFHGAVDVAGEAAAGNILLKASGKIGFTNYSNYFNENYGINIVTQGATWPVRIHGALVMGGVDYGSNFAAGSIYDGNGDQVIASRQTGYTASSTLSLAEITAILRGHGLCD